MKYYNITYCKILEEIIIIIINNCIIMIVSNFNSTIFYCSIISYKIYTVMTKILALLENMIKEGSEN